MLDVVGLRGGVVGPVSFEVAAGACLAVMGPSGSGKSVLLRMVADLDPHSGLVSLDGVECGAMPGPTWRRRVMYVAPESGWWLDGVEAHFGADLAAARGLADRLGVRADVLAGPVARLSSGERQRLALIRALVLRPRVLLLDEPTGALDQESVARVEAVLRERLAEGVAMVLVTHDPAQAERLGGRQMRMAAGRLS